MNNFFPPMKMYRYPKSNAYIPPPNYIINRSSDFYSTDEINKIDNDNTDNRFCDNNAKNNQDKAKEKCNNITEKPLFEFHGIKLYNDDILILLLVFFLYKEHTNDNLLLIALFSLLF